MIDRGASVKAITPDESLTVHGTIARVEFTAKWARYAIDRARAAPTKCATDFPTQALNDATLALEQIDTIGDATERASMSGIAGKCHAIIFEALGLRRGTT